MNITRAEDAWNVPPSATMLLESLRGMGYSPGSAVADIIDNSIAAGAENIHVNFHWNGEDSWIAILDDGHGMSPDMLCQGMKLGCTPVSMERGASDLGRFGLGLKMASLSQCRRLTVASVRNQEYCCLRWDLDLLALAGDQWLLLRGAAPGSEARLDAVRLQPGGTLVLWEKLDRMFPVDDQEAFLDVIDEVEDHLAVTFNCYISESRLKIYINGHQVKGRDPLMAMHPETFPLPRAYVGAGTTVQGFILPRQSRLTDAEYKLHGRPGGWTASQGFYVYRNRRLILAGSWLGLPGLNRDPACNLARIRLDIPPSRDFEWKIDIRKSSARPPAGIRNELVRIARDVRSRARKIALGKKGPRTPTEDFDEFQLWTEERELPGIRHSINMSHPWIRTLLKEAGDPLAGKFRKLFKVLEQLAPLTSAEAIQNSSSFAGSAVSSEKPPQAMKEAISYVFQAHLDMGMSAEQARRIMINMNKFCVWEKYIATLGEHSDE